MIILLFTKLSQGRTFFNTFLNDNVSILNRFLIDQTLLFNFLINFINLKKHFIKRHFMVIFLVQILQKVLFYLLSSFCNEIILFFISIKNIQKVFS